MAGSYIYNFGVLLIRLPIDEQYILERADDELKRKKNVSFMRKRKDVYKAVGPGSSAESATVLAFGSLFTAPYKGSESHIDIQKAPGDPRIQMLIQRLKLFHLYLKSSISRHIYGWRI